MTDPLQKVLAAEAAARRNVDAARREFEEKLRAARIDATRIRSRNEQRTRAAVQHAEKECVARTMQEIDRLDTKISRQLTFDESEVEQRIESLVQRHIDDLWP